MTFKLVSIVVSTYWSIYDTRGGLSDFATNPPTNEPGGGEYQNPHTIVPTSGRFNKVQRGGGDLEGHHHDFQNHKLMVCRNEGGSDDVLRLSTQRRQTVLDRAAHRCGAVRLDPL